MSQLVLWQDSFRTDTGCQQLSGSFDRALPVKAVRVGIALIAAHFECTGYSEAEKVQARWMIGGS